jgi:hypothetical protein
MIDDEKELVPGFVPNRGELEVLAHFWAYEIIEYNWESFIRGIGSWKTPTLDHFHDRLNALCDLLGEKKAKEITDHVPARMAFRKDPELWKAFNDPDHREWGRVADAQMRLGYTGGRDRPEAVAVSRKEHHNQRFRLRSQ